MPTPTLEQTPFIVQSIEQKLDNFIKLFESYVKAEPQSEPDEQRFYGDKELGAYLNCTVQTINRLKRNGKLPFKRFGRKYYYLRSEIDKAFSGKGGRK